MERKVEPVVSSSCCLNVVTVVVVTAVAVNV